MKKSHIKLIIFNLILILFLILNNFILNILNYKNQVLLFVILIISFKILFGFEKDNRRYFKDIIFNILIILLSFFIIFYLLGLVIGFVKTTNYFSWYGLSNMIIPYIAVIVMKEYLRYQIVVKSEKNRKLIVLSFITFVLFDISGSFNVFTWKSNYEIFMFFSLNLLPALSRNIACFYIANKVGYKPNILWLTVYNLYGVLLPIVPKTGIYIGTMINFLFPIVLLYNAYSFFENRKKDIPTRDNKYKRLFFMPIPVVIILVIIYFTSGYFKYYTIAVGSGSMMPNINIGDIVIINQKYDINDIKVGQVIAYKYNNRIIIHRLVDIQKVSKELYFYTKGDANNAKDNYIIYEDMLIGVVNHKIPFLGLPTVWVNEV